jgi:hypothetical protein
MSTRLVGIRAIIFKPMDIQNITTYEGADKDEPLTKGFAYEHFATRHFLLNEYTKIIGDIMDVKIEAKIEKSIRPLEDKLDKHILEMREVTTELREMNRDSKIRIARLEKEVFGYASL